MSYTPDAPSTAVAELTIAYMISLLRSTQLANASMRAGNWKRYFGRYTSMLGIMEGSSPVSGGLEYT